MTIQKRTGEVKNGGFCYRKRKREWDWHGCEEVTNKEKDWDGEERRYLEDVSEGLMYVR